MTLYNIINPASLRAGEPEDISVILANLQSIAGVLNGGIDDGNLSPTAAIAAAKLLGYPTDAAKALFGDGTWKVPPTPPPSGDEMAYAELGADLQVTATTAPTAQTVVTAPAITVDGSTPIIVEFFAPSGTPVNVAGAILRLHLWDGSTDLGTISYQQVPAAGWAGNPVRVARRLTPSAGAHTFSVRGWTSGGSGAYVYATSPMLPGFIRIRRVLPVPASVAPGSFTAVYYGTSFPPSPADGQEAILVDSVTNPTYQWRFRYNAGSSSPYKWEFIGGAPLHAEVFADETWTPTGAWTDTTGPRITLPRAGDYHAIGGSAQMTSVQDTHYMGLFNGTTTQLGMYTLAATAANTWSHLVMSTYGKNLVAGTDIRLRHQHAAAGTAHAQARWLDVVPVRVA